MSNPEVYITGGTIPPGSLYVKRDADDELLMLCRMRAFVYILSTRQVGKSSLMTNVASVLADEGVRSVIIDLSELGVEEVTADQWYTGLLNELRAQLALKVDVKAWWNGHAHLPYGQRLTLFLNEILLTQVADPVVIFVDEIDTTRSLVFTDDFYSAVRSVYNARARVPKFQRLSFVLVGVATPTDLIRDPKRTPFNIGQRVELTDFTFEEALPLTSGLGIAPDDAKHVLRHVLNWTNGHPYLTLRLLHDIAEKTHEGKTDWPEQDIDGLVEGAFFGNEGDNNLSFVRDMLTIHAPDLEGVLTTYRDIYLQRKPVPDEEHSVITSHLKLSGVVRRENGLLQVRNRIYRKAFDEAWIRTHMPPNWLRRLQRAAIAAVVLFFIALLPLALYAWGQKAKAEEALVKAELSRREAIEQRNEAERQRADADQQRQIAENARQTAEASAGIARTAKERAEKSAVAEREAKEVAVRQTLLAKAETVKANRSAQLARQAEERAGIQRQRAEAAARQAQQEREKAEQATHREEEQRRLAEARGQVGFARQLEIQGERAWDKSDTSAAEVFFANALAFDDRMETRGRVLGAMVRGVQKLWTSPARTVNQSVALSADGQMLAFVDDEHVLRLSDVKSGTEINKITVDGQILRMAFSPDESKLVTVQRSESDAVSLSKDVRIVVYDLKTRKPRTIEAGSLLYFSNLLFSQDARLIFFSSYGSAIMMVDVESGEISRLTAPVQLNGESFSLAISPDKRLLAGAGDDLSVTLFKRDSREVLGTLSIPEDSEPSTGTAARPSTRAPRRTSFSGTIKSITFSPDGNRLAAIYRVYGSASGDQVVIWDVATRQAVFRRTLTTISTSPLMTFSPDGRTLTLWNTDVVETWDITSGNRLSSYAPPNIIQEPAPTLSPDGRWLVLRTSLIRLQVYDTHTGAAIRTYPLSPVAGHSSEVNSVAFSHDGKLLASGADDAAVIVWDAASGTLMKSLLGHTAGVNSVAFSPTNLRLLAAGDEGGVIRLWNVETGGEIGKLMRTTRPPADTPQPALPPPTPATTNRLVGGAVNSVAFSPDGKLLASGSSDSGIRLWDVEKREMVGEICGGEGSINSVAFSPDGKLLASAGKDSKIRLWEVSSLVGEVNKCDLVNSNPFKVLYGHRDEVWSVTFHPNGKVLASNSKDKTVKLWNTEQGTELSTLPDQATYGKVVFSPDGIRLAVMSQEDSATGDAVRVWNWSTRKILTILRNSSPESPLTPTSSNPGAFSPDGTLFAIGNSDKTIKLWKFSPALPARLGRPLLSEAMTIDPSGRLIAYIPELTAASNSPNRPIMVKNTETGQLLELTTPQFKDLSWDFLTFSRDGKLLASISTSKFNAIASEEPGVTTSTVVIWDVVKGIPVNSRIINLALNPYSLFSDAAMFSPDGRWFVTNEGSQFRASDSSRDADNSKVEDEIATLWDFKKGETRTVQFTSGTLWSVAFSPDSEWLVLGGGASGAVQTGSKTIELLHIKSNEKVIHKVGLGGAVLSMTFSPPDQNKELLLAVSSGNTSENLDDPLLKLIKFPSFEPLPILQQFLKGIPRVMFVPGGPDERLMITLSNGSFRLWDLNTAPLKDKDGLILNTDLASDTAAFATDGQRLLIPTEDLSLASIDLSLPRYLLKASAREILERAQRRASLHVTGLDNLDFPILSQRELEQRLKDKYDFSFSLLPLPEIGVGQKPQGTAVGREGSVETRP